MQINLPALLNKEGKQLGCYSPFSRLRVAASAEQGQRWLVRQKKAKVFIRGDFFTPSGREIASLSCLLFVWQTKSKK